jgi:hypothetical protein
MENVVKDLKKDGHPELLAGGILSAVAGAEAAAGAAIACGAGACTAGAVTAAAVTASCPFCALGGVALLSYGFYKKWKASKKQDK